MLKDNDISLKDKDVVISGSGNVAIYATEKVQELGGNVIALSDSDGYVHDPDGIKLDTVKRIKEIERGRIKEYADEHSSAEYHDVSSDIWSIDCDIALPCATQNELNEESARILAENGVIAVGEGANMPSTPKAINVFLNNDVFFVPAKAANAGGVATSGLEMTQNGMWDSWSFDKVDKALKDIMINIYKDASETAARYGKEGNLVAGANICGFMKVANAMLDQGVV